MHSTSWVLPWQGLLFFQVLGVLAQIKADKDSVEALIQPIDMADRLFQEIQTWQKQVDDLEYKLDFRGQGVKSMEEVQSELTTLQSTKYGSFIIYSWSLCSLVFFVILDFTYPSLSLNPNNECTRSEDTYMDVWWYTWGLNTKYEFTRS